MHCRKNADVYASNTQKKTTLLSGLAYKKRHKRALFQHTLSPHSFLITRLFMGLVVKIQLLFFKITKTELCTVPVLVCRFSRHAWH